MTEDRNRNIRRIRKITIGVFILVFIGFFANNLWIWASQRFGNGNLCLSNDIPRIEEIIGFRLPPHPDNLWSYCKGGKGYAGWITFEIDPSGKDAVLSNSFVHVLSAGKEHIPHFSFPDEAIVAKLNQINSYLYGDSGLHDLDQRILIDTSNPTKFTVYIQVVNLTLS